MKAGNVIDLFSDAVGDPERQTWSKDDALMYLNQAILWCSMLRPESTVVMSILDLVAGTKQTLPADCLQLITCYRNVNADGLPVGTSIRLIDRMALDDVQSAWHYATPDKNVYEYFFDDRMPNFFWTNPLLTGARIEIAYSRSPARLDCCDDDLPVLDSYVEAILEQMLYRALTRDSRLTDLGQKGFRHLANAFQFLGLKYKGEQEASPTHKGA